VIQTIQAGFWVRKEESLVFAFDFFNFSFCWIDYSQFIALDGKHLEKQAFLVVRAVCADNHNELAIAELMMVLNKLNLQKEITLLNLWLKK
jgi:hypothetical protein